MLYDPFLRKDSFADKPWYGDFLIFHNIGVCQPQDEHVAEIRVALARFLFATRTSPGKEPGMTFIFGDGAIEAGNMAAYIKAIRGEGKEKRQHIYKIIAEGEYIPNDNIEQALAGMGLTITGIQAGYSLEKTLETLPAVIPGLASACRSTLEDGEFPDGWDQYVYVDDVIGVCDTDNVAELARKISGVILRHEDSFNADTMTAELILFCSGGLI